MTSPSLLVIVITALAPLYTNAMEDKKSLSFYEEETPWTQPKVLGAQKIITAPDKSSTHLSSSQEAFLKDIESFLEKGASFRGRSYIFKVSLVLRLDMTQKQGKEFEEKIKSLQKSTRFSPGSPGINGYITLDWTSSIKELIQRRNPFISYALSQPVSSSSYEAEYTGNIKYDPQGKMFLDELFDMFPAKQKILECYYIGEWRPSFVTFRIQAEKAPRNNHF